MTASEKLRALDGAMTPGPWHGESVGTYYPQIAALRNALPLIADVVEAAERIAAYDLRATQHLTAPLEGWRAILVEDVDKIVEASNRTLRALTALREHLERQ